jgi:hypothetical protein
VISGGVTIFSNGVRVSWVLVNRVVFVSHEFQQSFFFEDVRGATSRVANSFSFDFGAGIGGCGSASGFGFGVTQSRRIGVDGKPDTGGEN